MLVTTTSLALPAARSGVVAVIDVKPVTETLVAGWPPIVTSASAAKSVPAIVTFEPPLAGPAAGLSEKTIRCESSDVFPEGSVAVAAKRAPAVVVTGSMMSKPRCPRRSS